MNDCDRPRERVVLFTLLAERWWLRPARVIMCLHAEGIRSACIFTSAAFSKNHADVKLWPVSALTSQLIST